MEAVKMFSRELIKLKWLKGSFLNNSTAPTNKSNKIVRGRGWLAVGLEEIQLNCRRK